MEQFGGVARVRIEAEESGPTAPGYDKKGDLPAGNDLQPGKPAPAPAASDNAPVKPDWCPDKFWKDGKVDQEGLAKSYGELEKSKSKPADPNTKPDDALKAQQPALPSNIPGINADQATRFTKEMQESGQLSEQSYTDLKNAGYSKETVDSYISGIKASQEAGQRLVTEMKARAGGDEQYQAMAQWMRDTLTPAEINAYDRAVTSKDRATIELAIDGMKAKYTAAVGSEPALLAGRQAGKNDGDVYESAKQVTADMKDPRYKNDEAFRTKVREKIARSNVL